jgi:hypothetical protein
MERRERGSLEPLPGPSGPKPRITPEEYPALIAQLEAHPDATLEEHCTLWAATGHAAVSTGTMCRAQRRVVWTRKKDLDRQ